MSDASLKRAAALVSVALLLAACAATGERPPGEDPPPFRDALLTMASARAAVTPGTSTRTDVIAALGEGVAVRFDTGWEVRVYRDRRQDANTSPAELVVLFSPGGMAHKVRLKPAYALPPIKGQAMAD
ncbi:MAG: hypothetical protein EOO28_25655 [Comamonadaceae bacterium]|nr:MAG: hypothetical protein EOO28_25655 [Comamonadaceae bacterium]